MFRLKLIVIGFFTLIVLIACSSVKPNGFALADSKKYEASLFRQNCAICHGFEGEGKTLADGKQVPSLRSGDFKFKAREQIRKQISEGGNGMTPFNRQLTERELNLMTDFVYHDLRGQ